VVRGLVVAFVLSAFPISDFRMSPFQHLGMSSSGFTVQAAGNEDSE
jgi:hypothetical protein